MKETSHISIWWNALLRPEAAAGVVLGPGAPPGFDRFLCLAACALYGVYGVGMGSFRGPVSGIASGIKLPFLYLLTLAVCGPLLYALNCLAGPRLEARQCARLLLMATTANAVALASYAPAAIFFTLTTSREGYGFLVLMHVAAFAASGAISLAVVGVILRSASLAVGRPLRASFPAAWGAAYAFVGSQMSWTLRPWIGSWNAPYSPLRPIGGSFFESVWRLLT